MKIAVLVSSSVHPVSGIPRRSSNDAAALEVARQVPDSEVVVLHAGDASDAALPGYLAAGVEEIIVISMQPGDDAVEALLPCVADSDLILSGTRAEHGEASGMVPYLIAHALQRPLVAQGLALEARGNVVQVTQFLPRGTRRRIEVRTPAVVSVHPMAPVRPRYAFAKRRAGRIRVVPGSRRGEVPSDAWVCRPTTRAPHKLVAVQDMKGHARMLAAVTSDTRAGRVVNDGSDVEKAQVLLAYLREHGYVDARHEETE